MRKERGNNVPYICWNATLAQLTHTLSTSDAKAHKGRFALFRFLRFFVQKTQWFILKWFPEIVLIPLYGQQWHNERLALTYGMLRPWQRVALAASALNHRHGRILAQCLCNDGKQNTCTT